MDFFEFLYHEFCRAYRHIASWIGKRLSDLLQLFKISCLFCPFVCLAAVGHELTYSKASMVEIGGWVLIVFCATIVIWAFVIALNGNGPNDPEAPFLWVIFLLISIVAVSVPALTQYEFASPFLVFVSDPVRFAAEQELRLSQNDLWLVPTTTFGKDHSGKHLTLWVESVRLTEHYTVLGVACKTWYTQGPEENLRSARQSYIVDSIGNKYDILADLGHYGWPDRTVVSGEVYKWKLLFPHLSSLAPGMQLRHPQFEDIDIMLTWPVKK